MWKSTGLESQAGLPRGHVPRRPCLLEGAVREMLARHGVTLEGSFASRPPSFRPTEALARHLPGGDPGHRRRRGEGSSDGSAAGGGRTKSLRT